MRDQGGAPYVTGILYDLVSAFNMERGSGENYVNYHV